MSYVGAFATSDLGPELLVVVAIHRPPRDRVKLCRLSDGHCFSLNPSRVQILKNGCASFEKHALAVVNEARKSVTLSTTASDTAQMPDDWLSEYIRINENTSASYRSLPLTTYIIQREFERSHFSAYTAVDCWKHVCHMCELLEVPSPTVGVVRSRLREFAGQILTSLKDPLR
ncbi:transposase [Pseudomonas brassicacearum]